MGAVVVEMESDREFLVIDGQQRLATIGIFTLAVIGELHRMAERGIDPERNRERAQELRKRFIGEKDPASLVESSRLNLNETDDAFYQDYLVQLRDPHNPRGLHRSAALLWLQRTRQCGKRWPSKPTVIEMQRGARTRLERPGLLPAHNTEGAGARAALRPCADDPSTRSSMLAESEERTPVWTERRVAAPSTRGGMWD